VFGIFHESTRGRSEDPLGKQTIWIEEAKMTRHASHFTDNIEEEEKFTTLLDPRCTNVANIFQEIMGHFGG